MKLNIKNHNLTDIINLKFGVYKPLTEFVSKEDFLNIVSNFKTKENKFFPFPIFFDISANLQKKIKIKKKIRTFL